MLSDTGLRHYENVPCSRDFTFLISCMKWTNVTGLEGENIKGHFDVSKFLQLSGTAGKCMGNVTYNGFKLGVIKHSLVFEVMSEDNHHLMALRLNI